MGNFSYLIIDYAKNGRYNHFFHELTHDGFYLVEEDGERGLLGFNDIWVIPLGKDYLDISYVGNDFLKVHDPRCGNETQRTDAFAAMPQT